MLTKNKQFACILRKIYILRCNIQIGENHDKNRKYKKVGKK